MTLKNDLTGLLAVVLQEVAAVVCLIALLGVIFGLVLWGLGTIFPEVAAIFYRLSGLDVSGEVDMLIWFAKIFGVSLALTLLGTLGVRYFGDPFAN